VTDGVDATVHRVQPSGDDTASDRGAAQPDAAQLPRRDGSGLADGQRGHLEVRGELSSHTDA
jgi:hypothetical protein